MNLLALIGEIQKCECGALYLLDTDEKLRQRLAVKARKVGKYDLSDARQGVYENGDAVWQYANSESVLLGWARQCPTLQEIRGNIKVESGDWLNEMCVCGGQIKVKGIFKIQGRKMVCYSCEFDGQGEPHDGGNFTK